MKDLLARVASRETIIADGAMGSMLIDRGLEPGACPEALNLERPELLEEIAGLYLDAGAEIIQANTFGGSPLKLAMYHLDDRMAEINRAAVRATRKAVGERAHVSCSIGPTGHMLKPLGDVEPETVRAGYVEQVTVLLEAGVDVVNIETMTDLVEAKLAIEAARQAMSATGHEVPLLATMTYDRTPRGYFTIMGIDIPTAAAGLADAGADVIGSNCGNGIENMIEIARGFRACSSLPLIIQSNAGLPELTGGRAVYGESPEFMARKAKELVAAGVSIIGGCCGTTPEHIRALREMLGTA